MNINLIWGIENIFAILRHIFSNFVKICQNLPFCTNMSEDEAVWDTVYAYDVRSMTRIF